MLSLPLGDAWNEHPRSSAPAFRMPLPAGAWRTFQEAGKLQSVLTILNPISLLCGLGEVTCSFFLILGQESPPLEVTGETLVGCEVMSDSVLGVLCRDCPVRGLDMAGPFQSPWPHRASSTLQPPAGSPPWRLLLWALLRPLDSAHPSILPFLRSVCCTQSRSLLSTPPLVGSCPSGLGGGCAPFIISIFWGHFSIHCPTPLPPVSLAPWWI